MYLTLASVGLVWGLTGLLAIVNASLPWQLNAPSVLAVFGGLFALFRAHLWKWPLLHRAGAVKVPDLNGTWQGYLKTSYDDYASEHPIEITIIQNWTHLCVQLRTNHSRSHSLTASILTDHPGGVTLSYEYQNEPHADSAESMVIHRGMTNLHIEDEGVLEGTYYTGRGRGTLGIISLQRAKK